MAMTKDKLFNWKFYLCCGFFIWFILNLLQGQFTEIQEDETYYALYGEHLAWGYFDHPPMVGLMTFLSSFFFSGALGVRFFTILSSCLSLYVLWCIVNPKNGDISTDSTTSFSVEGLTPNHVILFFTLAFSIVMLNIYGFITTPDVCLILFSALFLLVYQHYLEHNTWKNALLLGLMMALMIYSKYHAVLLLGLIVLSNLRLLKDGKFYVACLVALVLLLPHIIWQVKADFPSFRYHLLQRSEPFRWSYFFEYLPNQLLVFNPFTFGAMVYVLFKHHATNVFERGLRFFFVGFFLFFWLMAFRGHVEPHWTIDCAIPVVVLIYRKSLIDEKLRRYIHRFVMPSLLLVIAFRIVLLTPLAARFGFGGKEAYYKAVESVAGDCPVVFRGSFQQPSLYHYFTGKESSTLCAYFDRKTQFDLWQFDMDWAGKPVFVCGHVLGLSQNYHVGDVVFEGCLMKQFQSANRLKTDFSITNYDTDKTLVLHSGDTLQIHFSIYNPYTQPVEFKHDEMSLCIKAQYLMTNEIEYCFYDDNIVIAPHSTYEGHLYTIVGDSLKSGRNRLTLGIGDRISSFITEENYRDVIVVGE